MAQKVSIFNAKTNLSHLISQVAQGAEFVITKHNEEVARLTPIESNKRILETKAVIDQIKRNRSKFCISNSIAELKSIGRK